MRPIISASVRVRLLFQRSYPLLQRRPWRLWWCSRYSKERRVVEPVPWSGVEADPLLFSIAGPLNPEKVTLGPGDRNRWERWGTTTYGVGIALVELRRLHW